MRKCILLIICFLIKVNVFSQIDDDHSISYKIGLGLGYNKTCGISMIHELDIPISRSVSISPSILLSKSVPSNSSSSLFISDELVQALPVLFVPIAHVRVDQYFDKTKYTSFDVNLFFNPLERNSVDVSNKFRLGAGIGYQQFSRRYSDIFLGQYRYTTIHKNKIKPNLILEYGHLFWYTMSLNVRYTIIGNETMGVGNYQIGLGFRW